MFQVIPSHNCHMNMGIILNGYGTMGIRNLEIIFDWLLYTDDLKH
jgi:hypothetical protein